MKIKLRALREMYYASKTRYPGDEFECDHEPDARILTAPDLPGGQKAEYVDPPKKPAPPPPPMQTRAQEAESPKSAEPMITDNTDSPSRKRYYRRRDMQAED